MADHTVVGHQIVSNVQFPWPQIPEIVRWHHERETEPDIQTACTAMKMPQASALWP